MPEESKDAGDEVLGVIASGTVITEELAEQWATEFENEDLDFTDQVRWHVIPLLLPSEVAAGSGVTFPLSSSELDAIRAQAENEDRSLVELIREVLDS
jgi:hypothetical protein